MGRLLLEKLLDKASRIQGLIDLVENEAEKIRRLPKDMNEAIRQMVNRGPAAQSAQGATVKTANPNQAMSDAIRIMAGRG